MILRFINNLFRSNKTSSSHIDDRVEPLFAEALAMHQKGQIVQAQALYYEVLKVQPKHFDAIHLLGVIFCQTNNFDHAIELFNQAIALRPNDAAIYSNQGNALQHLKQYKAALDSYNMAIGLNPGHAETYNDRGVAVNNLKQYGEAIQSYSQAIALNSHDAKHSIIAVLF